MLDTREESELVRPKLVGLDPRYQGQFVPALRRGRIRLSGATILGFDRARQEGAKIQGHSPG